ncbi:MAG: response regulator transcription factor, partial [Clostridia bacterium]|nr:response regulator transcription factor [Clostridia bacterium]
MDHMLDIAICDDEQIFISKISEYIISATKNQGIKYRIHNCQRGTELIKLCEEKNIDAVFLDIAMPGINGFETAEQLLKIRSNLILIFVSSKETMVFSSYEYKPFWFVPKSQMSMMEIVVNKLIKKIELEAKEYPIIAINVEDNRVVEIDIREIAYFKTDDHYIRMAMKRGKKSDSYRYKLDAIEQQLEDKWFVRIHSRYLVNCRMISTIDKNTCVLVNGEHIPISRVNMASAKSIFQKYLR